MKEDEVLKIILNLGIDNINQQRELFKHIALLSSAIIGVFVFSKEQSLSLFSEIGIIGLFLVIIISILLLFFVLIIEKNRLNKNQEIINNITKIKKDVLNKSLFELINKENIELMKEIFKEDKADSTIDDKIFLIISKLWNGITSSDREIEERKKESIYNEKSKKEDKIIIIMAIVGIILFVLSLGFILFDILF
ncbi:MAG: hypothetical protein WAW15_00500 [Minisyncoccales bacterium]